MLRDRVYSQTSRRCDHLEGTSDLGVQLGVEEVVVRVGEAEGGAEESFGGGAVGGVAGKYVSGLLQRGWGEWIIGLHGEAIIHKTERRRPDDGANVFGDRRRLVEGSELVDCADGFFFTPRSAAGEHFQHYAAERPDVDLGAVALVVDLGGIHVRAGGRDVLGLALRADDFWCHPEY